MKQEHSALPTVFGFLNPVEFYEELESLKSITMSYDSKSTDQLQAILNQSLEKEDYEKCAVIHSELCKRLAFNS